MFIFQMYKDKSLQRQYDDLKNMEKQLDGMVGKNVDPKEATELISKYNQKVAEFNSGMDASRYLGADLGQNYQPKTYSDMFIVRTDGPKKFEQSKETGTLDKTVISSMERELVKIKGLERQIADYSGRSFSQTDQDELSDIYTDYRRSVETYNMAVQTNNKYSQSKLKEYEMIGEPAYVLAGQTGDQVSWTDDKYFTSQQTEKRTLDVLEANLKNLKSMKKDAKTKKEKDGFEAQIKKLETIIAEAKMTKKDDAFVGPTLPGGFKTGKEYKDALKKLKGREKELKAEIEKRNKQLIELTKLATSNDKTVAAVSMHKIQTLQREIREFEALLKDVQKQEKKTVKISKHKKEKEYTAPFIDHETGKEEEITVTPKPLFGGTWDEKLFEIMNGNQEILRYFTDDLKDEKYAKFNDYFGLLGEGHTPDYERLKDIVERINLKVGADAQAEEFKKYVEEKITGKDKNGEEIYKGGNSTYYFKGYTASLNLLETAKTDEARRKEYAKDPKNLGPVIEEPKKTNEEKMKDEGMTYISQIQPKTSKDIIDDTTPITRIKEKEPKKKETGLTATEKKQIVSDAQKEMSDYADVKKAFDSPAVQEALFKLNDPAGVKGQAAYIREDVLDVYVVSLPFRSYKKNDKQLASKIIADLNAIHGENVKKAGQTPDEKQEPKPKKEETRTSVFTGEYATNTWFDDLGKDQKVQTEFAKLTTSEKKDFVAFMKQQIEGGNMVGTGDLAILPEDIVKFIEARIAAR